MKRKTRKAAFRGDLNSSPLSGKACAPKQYKDGTRIPQTCQTTQSIHKLHDMYTKKRNIGTISGSANSITKPSIIPAIITNSPIHKTNADAQMWNQLVDAHPSCKKNETCVVKQITGTSTLPADMYAPAQPSKWNAPMGDENTFWDNHNIQAVTDQYQQAYPFFYSPPISFINYDTKVNGGQCVSPFLCNMSLQDLLAKGKTDVGIVFNTDRAGGNGIHWICVYIQIPTHQIVFFDSLGDPPPKEITRFIHKIVKQDPRMKSTLICKPHQKLDGECGTYCIFALLLLLTGKPHISFKGPVMTWKQRIRYLTREKLPDAKIRKYRDLFMLKDSL